MTKARQALSLGFCSIASFWMAAPSATEALSPKTEAQMTPAIYRQRCLYCHQHAAPEGISPEITKGFRPATAHTPRDFLPESIICLRRCEQCWPDVPDPPKEASQEQRKR